MRAAVSRLVEWIVDRQQPYVDIDDRMNDFGSFCGRCIVPGNGSRHLSRAGANSEGHACASPDVNARRIHHQAGVALASKLGSAGHSQTRGPAAP